jgi:hypothetical protein
MEQFSLTEMLSNVHAAKSEDIGKQVEAMFLCIARMSPDQTVAAYQAIDFLETTVAGDPRIQKVRHAIIGRMQALVNDPPKGMYGSLQLRPMFKHVVGTAWED